MNNSKILLSSIVISILCSVSLEAAYCPDNTSKKNGNATVVSTDNNKTCTLKNDRWKGGFNLDWQANNDSIGNTLDANNFDFYGGGLIVARNISGKQQNQKADKNTLKIKDSNVTATEVVAAQVNNGGESISATSNSLIISGSTVNASNHIFGVWIPYGGGTATDNNITIDKNATIATGNVYGAVINSNGKLYKNNVVIDSATVTGSIFGGGSKESNSTVNENSVTIKNGAIVKNDVFGGSAGSGS